MNIREIAYEYTSRAGADDIWDRVIIQMEAALRRLLQQAIDACEGRAKENHDASFLQRRLEDVEVVKILQAFDQEQDEDTERRTQHMLDICYQWTRDQISDDELKNRFARMLRDYTANSSVAAEKKTERRYVPDGEDEETRANRPDRHEIRFKDGSRHDWLIVLWQSGETTIGDCTWAYTVDRERAGDMVEVYQGEITGQGDQLPNPRDIILDYFMYVAGAMFTGVEHWQIMYPDGRKESA